MRRLAAPLLLLLVAACASRADNQPQERRPPVHKMSIRVITNGVRMGGYTVILKWDPTLASIEKITPTRAPTFPANPECSERNFTRGWLRIFGSTNQNHDVPDEYDVCYVIWRPLRPGLFKPTVEIEALYDMAARPRPITGHLNVFPAEFDFGAVGQ